MTLGRTPAGAIKIKKDDPLGLRAVECACCVNCGCATAISGDLLQTMRNATTGTCNGASPIYFNASGGGFSAYWYVSGTFYTCALSALTNCFSFNADNAMNTMSVGLAESCCPTNLPFPVTCANVTYTINGDLFDAHTENFGFGSDVTPPTFIFS
jgi:hypothetical protein